MNTEPQKKVSLAYLFFTLLKIGSTAFGGFMLLVSVVQNQFVDKDKLVDNDTILDGVSLASMLPGPVASNTVSYLGYKLRGFWGGMLALFAVTFPSFVLVLVFAFFYERFGDNPIVEKVLAGFQPAVAAIIFAVAYNMAKKSVKKGYQWVILIGSAVILFFFKSFFITLSIIGVSALLGWIYNTYISPSKEETKKAEVKKVPFKINKSTIISLVVGAILVAAFFFFPSVEGTILAKCQDIAATFAGISVSLFGGGYVMIPIMQDLLVVDLQWLTEKEFLDAIAVGQITPGPILITSTFVGYKVAGFWGAVAATISIFVPPALLIITATKLLQFFKNNKHVEAAFKGIRPGVIGMIIIAAVVICKGFFPDFHWGTGVIFFAVLIASAVFKINAVYLLPASGLLGYLLYSI